MKKLLILLLSIVISSCVDPQDLDFSLSIFCAESPKIKGKDGLFYLPNEELPYSGDNICIYKGSGGYAIQGEIKNGVKYGVETSWYKNGQIMKKGNFIDGKEDGKMTLWNEDGTISSEVIYKDGECISGDCSLVE